MMDRKTLAISEMKLEKCHEQGYECPVCHEYVDMETGELAHKIPKSKWCLAKWGPEILHHRFNVDLVHHKCNDAVSISNHPVEMEALAEKIRKEREQ